MFFLESLETKIKKNEQKAEALFQEILTLYQQEKIFLDELKVTPEQLTTFISAKENFTEQNWETLNFEKQKLDQKLQTELNNIRNPKKTKKAYSEKKIEGHWLYIK